MPDPVSGTGQARSGIQRIFLDSGWSLSRTWCGAGMTALGYLIAGVIIHLPEFFEKSPDSYHMNIDMLRIFDLDSGLRIQKGYIMAKNRKIFVHRNSEYIHMKLIGDFDGSLAYELLNLLKNNCTAVPKIFIHTNCLRTVNSFGRQVFHKNLNHIDNQSTQLLFTGEFASQLIPENNGLSHIISCWYFQSSEYLYQIYLI